MKKRNIGFILFGVAGANLITLPILLIVFPRLYALQGMPLAAIRIAMATVLIVGLIPVIALLCAGIIVLIKFWNR
ncbi:MAG: hypothetical protein R3255_02770 [Candidatus Lokiarchaeia archaeon]|nr:hypothetical protein [Candidatus Lokiarchaeia archaeon]